MAKKKKAKKATKKEMTQKEALNAIAVSLEKKQKADKTWRWIQGVMFGLVVIFFYFGNIITYYLNQWVYSFINK